MASTPGTTIGPPALRLYAVEPVGVAMMMPVRAVRADVLTLDEDVDPHHARHAALVHGDVVDRHLDWPGSRPAVLDRGLERLAPLGDVAAPPPEQSSAVSSVSRVAVVRKPTRPRLTPRIGVSRPVEEPGAAEQRAVAAEGDQRVELGSLERRDLAPPERRSRSSL